MDENLVRFKNLFSCVIDEKQTVKFLTSCVSEGLIPTGFRNPFNLAKDVNDETFVGTIQDECDKQSSRLLDLHLFQRDTRLLVAVAAYESCRNEVIELFEQDTIEEMKSGEIQTGDLAL